MPYGVTSPVAEESPVSIFKLKRSWEDIKALRNFLEESSLPLGEDSQALQDEVSLEQAEEIIQADPLHETNSYDSDPESELESVASDDSEVQIKRKEEEFATYSVSHPWNIVDYHLYLCSVERGKDTHARRNGLFVYDGLDCRPMSYHEFLDDQVFDPCNVGDDPQFLFVALPIADAGPAFRGRHYILGFDYNKKSLFARHFEWIPSKTDDLWSIWDHGFTMYSVEIADLLALLDSSLSQPVHVNVGFLSSSPYCVALGADDDPGMEIVITILFCQWMLDFADAILQPDRATLDKYKERLSYYMDECRLILQRASYRAWFASRDGYTREKYTRNASVNKFINDLYTFDKSLDSDSLDGQWRAPGLDTCHRLRQQDRRRRREATEMRLQNLFTIPEVDSPVSLADPMADAEEEREAVQLSLSEGGADAVRGPPAHAPSPAVQQHSDGADYQNVPLSELLKRTLELIEKQPELDTMDHRGQMGELLTEMQVGRDE
ncbi:predicted protein [Aspergillus terreus NIH2624]|uniref:Uncharacterized protein n=1 Tax=Aspergillus terreus (strain NIH 2624 / FGSC A1156) TaxID=341663 RepID=Q0CCP6_ASPTN|nr:uncharacterized protein ATEG_08538 [Aspergillus terreus NIH2624]EAU30670.1 predicted protein [Aspergillus terreus NIH2624]